ncbi:MAG: 50S ribosomal protein L34e [Nanoarchaeota archaeon]
MPSPQHRSRKLNRHKRKVPGGRVVTHYTEKKSSRPVCASCRKILQGVSASATKSKKRPQRAFGGVMCFNCLQSMMVEKARSI